MIITKQTRRIVSVSVTLACGAALLLTTLSSSAQLATAFTYQGRLNDTNGPLTGTYDFVFSLYDTNDNPIGPLITNASVLVVEGYFTQVLDFGQDSFKRVFLLSPRGHYEGPGEWLEIWARKSSGHPGAFVTLSPRHHLTPSPFAAALTTPLASSALDGTYASEVYFSNVSNRFRGEFIGDGSSLSNLHPSSLAGPIPESFLSTNVALRLGGNAFSGNQTVTSGNVGIGTIAPDATLDVRSKILSQGGSGNNENLVIKKTLSLGTLNAEMVFSHRSSGTELWLYGNNGISGYRNLQGWHYASNAVRFPADGQTLYIDEGQGRVGVGRKPVADVLEVGGDMSVWGDVIASRLNIGTNNTLSGTYATIAGGSSGKASGGYSTVVGGYNNVADGHYSLAAGRRATAAHDNSFIWNGDNPFQRSTTGDGRFEVYAPGGAFFSGDLSCATLTIRGGADLAEPFAMSDDAVQPGAVVVIDPDQPGRLKLSTSAYDHKVAGIVSGAGGVQPGISMIQTEKLEGGRNVALSGRVFALVDATKGPVQPGDLLTTSDTPGHAMKAANPALAQGAILGKAMTPLREGRGLVLVLVSLQ